MCCCSASRCGPSPTITSSMCSGSRSAGASILYQTQTILRRYPAEAYVGASVQLFASVMLLFWYVLRLLGQLCG